MDQLYDILIIGGGPAGLTAGVYAARARLKVLLIERAVPGGQIINSEKVENYPGFPEGISGFELGERMHRQATNFGLETVFGEVVKLEIVEGRKIVKTSDAEYAGKAVILASGADYNKLGVPGEAELIGKGVSYCATCDGAFFKDQPVAVVGGGDSAIEEALFLTRFASKVTVIHRRDQLRASKILQERAFANPTMGFLWDTVVEAIEGSAGVTGVALRNVKTGQRSKLAVPGVFLYVGLHPNVEYLKDVLPLDNGGHVPVNLKMETVIHGVFAAGDIRQHSARQVVTAAGDGATAALSVEKYLNELG